jgi:A-kinase anchor protein 1
VGKLIGHGGYFIQHIRSTARVSIVVRCHPSESDYKICKINGTPDNIAIALEIIRQLFPTNMYPFLSLEQLDYEILPEEIPCVPELIQLSLIEGVNNDVIVSHIVKPNHLFIQLPTHPTYPSLRILDDKMTQLYETVESPPVPDELKSKFQRFLCPYNFSNSICLFSYTSSITCLIDFKLTKCTFILLLTCLPPRFSSKPLKSLLQYS